MCGTRTLTAAALAVLAVLSRPIVAPSTAPQPAAPTPDAIARQVQDRNTGRDSRSEMRMKLYDRHGRMRERALSLVSLRGRGAPGASADAPNGDRLLIRFTYPNDIRGTSFLVWEHPRPDVNDVKSEDERFLYLPSLGRVRRIAGAETQESFVGSDFTYEDIGGRELEDYTYAFADGSSAASASWTPSGGGAPRDAWRLESRRKDASAEFPRVVSLVLKDSFVVVGADIYNRRNEKQKVYTVRRLDQVEGIWTVMDSEMVNSLEKTRTELAVVSIDYNVGLKESDFSRRELERAVR
jgi:Outer membrane lipoprotein-sorting protein